MPYGTGKCTYCSCIAKVAFLSIFPFFFIIYTTYRKKKLHSFAAELRKFNFFCNSHDSQQKKITLIYRKKITPLDGFFVHDLHFSRIIQMWVIYSGIVNLLEFD